MSKASKADSPDDLLPEYDFSSMSGAVRGKYYRRYRAGVNLVLLEPAVARAFPTDRAVNEALRSVMTATKAAKRRARPTNKSTRTRSATAGRRGPRR